MKKVESKQEKKSRTIEDVIKKRRARLRNMEDIRYFLKKLALFAGIVWLLFFVVFGLKPMPDMTMHPRISPRDILFYYRLSPQYEVSDVVILEKAGATYIGRIVARPQDKVEITNDGKLRINDALVIENDVYYHTKPYDSDVQYPLILGEDEYFVLGDYREGAKDSRYYGSVHKKELQGEVIAVIRKSGL